MLLDTHCHLDMRQFDGDRPAVLQRAAAAGVAAIIVPAIDLQNVTAVTDLAQIHEGVFAAVGIHPNSSAGWTAVWLETVRAAAALPKVVAIGEIGLDYYWDDAPHNVQHEALRRQLALAADLDLPVIIHNREASADVVQLLAKSPLAGRERPGVLLLHRPSNMRAHPGQIAFPGGKRDLEDGSLWQTALREAEEEIGLNPDGVEALGRLPSIATPSGYIIHPYVAWNHGSPPLCPPNPEVDRVFSLCLYELAQRGPEGDGFPSPYGRIWGATAWILYQYLEILKLKPA